MKPNTSTTRPSEATQPAVTVVEITDPSLVDENFEILDQDVVQINSKPLLIKRTIVQLGDSIAVYQSTNLPVRSRTSISDNLLGFVSFGSQAQGTINGLPVGPDLLLIGPPGLDVEFVVKENYESITIFHPPSSLKIDLEARQRADEYRIPQGLKILQSTASSAQILFKKAKSIIDAATLHPSLFDDHQTIRRTAHFELLETLLETLEAAEHYIPTQKDQTKQSYSKTVQTAQDFAINNTLERLSITDLCKACSVSERTLQYAFKKIMGMTPIGYLNKLRLHRVREDLQKMENESGSVSSAAIRWGFWHFGDFSRAYKKCFNERPSDTAKKEKI